MFPALTVNRLPEQLKEVFPATMELCILAFGFALIVGIPVGMIAGITRHKWQDNLINAIAPYWAFQSRCSGWRFC